MNKEEMKNKISMALKDPILQQGFEIICKENVELNYQKQARNIAENAVVELSKKNAEAKEIIKDMYEYTKVFYPKADFVIKAEAFINGKNNEILSI